MYCSLCNEVSSIISASLILLNLSLKLASGIDPFPSDSSYIASWKHGYLVIIPISRHLSFGTHSLGFTPTSQAAPFQSLWMALLLLRKQNMLVSQSLVLRFLILSAVFSLISPYDATSCKTFKHHLYIQVTL